MVGAPASQPPRAGTRCISRYMCGIGYVAASSHVRWLVSEAPAPCLLVSRLRPLKRLNLRFSFCGDGRVVMRAACGVCC
eukprot:scaffold4779_cov116-Isochrysis_galbana.AAC.18